MKKIWTLTDTPEGIRTPDELDALKESLRHARHESEQRSVRGQITRHCKAAGLDVTSIVPVEAAIDIWAVRGDNEIWALRLALAQDVGFWCCACYWRGSTLGYTFSDCDASGEAAGNSIESAISNAVRKVAAEIERARTGWKEMRETEGSQ